MIKLAQASDRIMQYRDMLMGFYASEITSHASLVIGFVGILFVILEFLFVRQSFLLFL